MSLCTSSMLYGGFLQCSTQHVHLAVLHLCTRQFSVCALGAWNQFGHCRSLAVTHSPCNRCLSRIMTSIFAVKHWVHLTIILSIGLVCVSSFSLFTDNQSHHNITLFHLWSVGTFSACKWHVVDTCRRHTCPPPRSLSPPIPPCPSLAFQRNLRKPVPRPPSPPCSSHYARFPQIVLLPCPHPLSPTSEEHQLRLHFFFLSLSCCCSKLPPSWSSPSRNSWCNNW